MIEGLRLASEALTAGLEPQLALYDAATLEQSELGQTLLAEIRGRALSFEATAAVIRSAAETDSPAGIILVIPEPSRSLLPLDAGLERLLVLDNISDPGNAGTILRSAAAAGLTHVVFARQCVDPFLGKVVRSGMGAHFRLQIIEADWADLRPELARFGQVILADAKAEQSIYDVDWTARTALIVGSESHGPSSEAGEAATRGARIPMAPGSESLNVGTATSVILFHWRRSSDYPDLG